MANFYGQFIGFGASGVSGAAYHGAGVSYGFTSSGGVGGSNNNQIEKFSLPSSTNAVDWGDVTVARRACGGWYSPTNGYTHGGYASGFSNVIDSYSYSSDAGSNDIGDLTGSRISSNGVSTLTDGYNYGGEPTSNQIEKFNFASGGNSSTVSAVISTSSRGNRAGGSESGTHGFSMGGGSSTDIIDKWPFASDTSATDIGNLTVGGYYIAGNSNGDFVYAAGRMSGSSTVHDTIDKVSTVTGTNATDVGNLTSTKSGVFGQNSTTHGYASGAESEPHSADIDKFSFASDGDAVDASQDLLTARGMGGSAQV